MNSHKINPSQLHHIVVNSLENNEFRKAIMACRQLNNEFPAYFEGWYIAGEIHRKLNKPLAGLISTERALAIQPNEPRVVFQRIECCLAIEQVIEAKALLLKLAENNLASKMIGTDIIDKTALLLSNLDLHDDALKQYKLAVSIEPKNAALHYNLATALRFLGKTEQAIEALDVCLTLNPLDFEAQGMRSSLKKQSSKHNHIDELKNVLGNEILPSEGKINICYALAKECDDINDTEQSFIFLKQGASQRRQQMSYNVDVDIEIIAAIKATYKQNIFNKGLSGDESAEPIFILGLPRTGTTLVERILSSHSDVFAAGELDNFGREMMKLSGNAKPTDKNNDLKNLSRSNLVSQSSMIDFAELGENYINSTRPLTGHTRRFIDKLPFNYLYAGLIHLALPNAKIINMTRHPMAACYAIYKQLFRDAYPFSYDFKDLAQYYIAYHQLMEHWKSVMPNMIYELSYENVVADIEGESKKLLHFCDLSWQEQCLRFYENKQASTTASASQVRQPIYSSSVERWRSYSEQLKPLQELLEKAGINTQ
jgi:tetratricopeptide (TPR) repeat protein